MLTDPLSMALEINEAGIARRIVENKSHKLDTSSVGSRYYRSPVVTTAENGHLDILKVLVRYVVFSFSVASFVEQQLLFVLGIHVFSNLFSFNCILLSETPSVVLLCC